MNTNDITAEIRRVREKQAEECGFDPKQIGERLRRRQHERAAQGLRYVSCAQSRHLEKESMLVQEEPENC